MITLGTISIIAVPAHFLHLVGNFQFYDPIAKDSIFRRYGGIDGDDALKTFENFAVHIPKMKGFHQRYMCNNKVIRLWVNMVRTMDVK